MNVLWYLKASLFVGYIIIQWALKCCNFLVFKFEKCLVLKNKMSLSSYFKRQEDEYFQWRLKIDGLFGDPRLWYKLGRFALNDLKTDVQSTHS